MSKFALKHKKVPLQAEIVTSKAFSYTVDGVALKFSLQTDNKKQATAFKKCLTKALADIHDLLEA